jgi:dTDP-4-dehydrorhamnose reductase
VTWLVTGAGGMLGTDLIARLPADAVSLTRSDLDLCDPSAVRAALREHRPATVVNCAAWTAVDDAETNEDAALAINGHAVGVLAEACADVGARLVQISTDYVFDGQADRPYPEDALTAPINAYGRTKLAGEQAAATLIDDGPGAYIVRTAWLYGAHGPSFVRTMARLAAERDTVTVVDDQTGQPTWTADLADAIITLAGSGAPCGIYHGTSSGRTSWYGLAREIFQLLGLDPDRVRPTTSDAFVRPAARPAWSVLGHDAWAKAGLVPVRHWRDALHAAWPTLSAAWA